MGLRGLVAEVVRFERVEAEGCDVAVRLAETQQQLNLSFRQVVHPVRIEEAEEAELQSPRRGPDERHKNGPLTPLG